MVSATEDAPHWTPEDLRCWRQKLGWTQARAADQLGYHRQAYKKLECGTRRIAQQVRNLCLLTLSEHRHALTQPPVTTGPGRQVFAAPERVAAYAAAVAGAGRGVRYVSLFSGLGSDTAALERIGAGAVPIAFAEVDPAANAVLRHRWPDVPRVGDVTGFDWTALEGLVDLVIAGPPCQSFSVAGRQLGLRDPRGNLTLHALRAIGAMQPRWVLIENVKGLLSANSGADFDLVTKSLVELGYACAWRVLDAQHFGPPARRQRLWLVAERSADGTGPVSVLALEQGPDRLAGSGKAAWKTSAARTGRGVGRVSTSDVAGGPPPGTEWVVFPPSPEPSDGRSALVGFLVLVDSDHEPALWQSGGSGRERGALPLPVYAASLRNGTIGEICPTLLTKSNSLNSNPCLIVRRGGRWALRRLTPRECLRLQGIDDDWLDGPRVGGKPLSDTERFRLAGNAWSVPTAAWVLERLIAYDRAGFGDTPRRGRAGMANLASQRAAAGSSAAPEWSVRTVTSPRGGRRAA